MPDRNFTLEEFDETENALRERFYLQCVRKYLVHNGAPWFIIETIDVAIEYVDEFVDPEIEVVTTFDGLWGRGKSN